MLLPVVTLDMPNREKYFMNYFLFAFFFFSVCHQITLGEVCTGRTGPLPVCNLLICKKNVDLRPVEAVTLPDNDPSCLWPQNE